MKLGLGTVQFGLTYGVNNIHGKPNLQQIEETLKLAEESGITILDTAADYGESESNLGKTLKENSAFRIVTKVSKNGSVRDSLLTSLNRLNRNQVYGLLLHDYQHFVARPQVWSEMVALKTEGLTAKVGFSIYSPTQLKTIENLHPVYDIVQVPYSILDQRFEKYFGIMKDKGVEIHVRSAFVQGLVFSKLDSINPFFSPIKSKLETLNAISQETGKSIESLCLNFVNANPYIDSIIIGVDTKQNLARNVAVLNEVLVHAELTKLRMLREDNEQMILPYNWKLK